MTQTVLIDLTCLRTGSRVRGIGRYTTDLALTLSRHQAGTDLRLLYLEDISWKGQGRVTTDAEAALSRLLDPSRREWSQAKRKARLRRALPRVVRTEKPGLLHLPEPNGVPRKFEGLVRLVTCHDLIPHRFPQYSRGLGKRQRIVAADRRRYGTADHVLCISEATARDLRTTLGIPSERCTTIYHGVDFKPRVAGSPARPERILTPLGVKSDYFLYVGDADFRKNADGMCAALGKLKNLGHSVPLVWAGRLSRRRHAGVKQLARQHDVHVAFAGYVDENALEALYAHASAMLFVSRWEGFGYPVLEAMAHGCPVITSNVSSLPEVAGDAALQVDPEAPSEIVAAMRRVLTEPDLVQTLCERGRVRLQSFTPLRQARETMALYRALLERARGSAASAA